MRLPRHPIVLITVTALVAVALAWLLVVVAIGELLRELTPGP